MSAPQSRRTKCEEVRSALMARLKSGEYRPGEKIPTEPELVELLGYSRSAVREAVGLLVNEGQLVRIQGSGTFVAEAAPNRVTIGVVIPGLEPVSTCIITRLFIAIEAEARRRGVRVIPFVVLDGPATEAEALDEVWERGLDAAIVFPQFPEANLARMERLRAAGIPLVMVDRYPEGSDLDYVVTDNRGGAYEAVKLIYEMGIRNVYYVSGNYQLSSVRERMAGYVQAVNEFGMSCNVVLITAPGNAVVAAGTNEYNCVIQSLRNHELPVAVLSMSTFITPTVMSVLSDLDVPPESRIVGYFDTMAGGACDGPYIEVDQPMEEIGRRAVEIAMDRMAGADGPMQFAVKPRISVRNAEALRTSGDAAISIGASERGNDLG